MGMRRGMEALLTGDSMSGAEAVAAGAANRCFALDQLDEEVVKIATRIALIPKDLLTLNKRVAHRAMEISGIRAGVRATAEIQALGFHQQSSMEYMRSFAEKGVSAALSDRDAAFSDYRERRD